MPASFQQPLVDEKSTIPYAWAYKFWSENSWHEAAHVGPWPCGNQAYTNFRPLYLSVQFEPFKLMDAVREHGHNATNSEIWALFQALKSATSE